MQKVIERIIYKILEKLSLRIISSQEKKIKEMMRLKEELMMEQWDAQKMSKMGRDDTLKELIYIDKNGNKWYSLSNYMNITMERFTNIQIAERYLQMNLTKEKLEEIVSLMKIKFDESSWVELGSLIAELIARNQFHAEKGIYATYMSLVFLINDEGVDFDRDINNRKIEIISKDSELFNFFLRELVERFNLFTSSYDKILDYLTKTEEMEMKLISLRGQSS